MLNLKRLFLTLVSSLLFLLLIAGQGVAQKRTALVMAARAPAYQGNFAALERITLENIIFKSTARKKIDFSYLTIAMDCTSTSDGLQYERSFQLSDQEVRPFTLRKTRAGRVVANSNFSAISQVGPRTGQVDISMGFSGRAWTVNIQVQAVGTDQDSSNINEQCFGTTIFRATKTLSNL